VADTTCQSKANKDFMEAQDFASKAAFYAYATQNPEIQRPKVRHPVACCTGPADQKLL